jgi:hypothetical protein
MTAPPMPCPARDSARSSGPVASPHSSDPAVKTAVPAANVMRRPNRSASAPAVSSWIARARDHRRLVGDVQRQQRNPALSQPREGARSAGRGAHHQPGLAQPQRGLPPDARRTASHQRGARKCQLMSKP